MSDQYLEAQTHLSRLSFMAKEETRYWRSILFFNLQTEEVERLRTEVARLTKIVEAAKKWLTLSDRFYTYDGFDNYDALLSGSDEAKEAFRKLLEEGKG